MNKTVILAIARKDIRQITSNVQVWLPMVIIPLVFCIIFPLTIVLFCKYGDLTAITTGTMRELVDRLPTGIPLLPEAGISEMNGKILYFTLNYMLLPLFLLLPIMASSVISANSFVGEKERRTMESLLLSPIRIQDLMVGKMLASFIPAYTLSLGGFLAIGIIVNTMTFGMFDGWLFPSLNWVIVILWLVPSFTIVSILLNVLISAKVKTFQAAQQMSGLVVLPIIMLLVGQMSGILLLSPLLLIVVGAVLLLACLFMLPRIARSNNRNALFERQI
ncbi:ABC transporter permease subunit [Paenibacillus sp. GCM10027626]|uniref:ABC transporter permease subunit n=1 Tax=Paenibacillus sp. GCM10027626 TaxID=3273411 RepID=UPI0036433F25